MQNGSAAQLPLKAVQHHTSHNTTSTSVRRNWAEDADLDPTKFDEIDTPVNNEQLDRTNSATGGSTAGGAAPGINIKMRTRSNYKQLFPGPRSYLFFIFTITDLDSRVKEY